MTEGTEAVTAAALGLALDAAILRQQAIAANIANANTVDYVPMAVNFEAQLEDARLSMQGTGRLDPATLAGVAPRLEQDFGSRTLGLPPKVMVDVEVAHLAENAVAFQALSRGLSRHYAILSAAVSDGKK